MNWRSDETILFYISILTIWIFTNICSCVCLCLVWWQVRCTCGEIITIYMFLFRLSQTHFLFHFISLLPLVYFFHFTHDTKLGHINNSRITLKYVCIESWYTRKYNVKILILCALKILYLRPPQFFMYQPYTL